MNICKCGNIAIPNSKLNLCPDCMKQRQRELATKRIQKRRANKDLYLKELEAKKEKNKLNKDKISQYNKLYRQLNKDKVREINRIYSNNKFNTDTYYKLQKSIRNLITDSFKGKGYKKNSKTEQILGCSFEQFKTYLESKFESWMTWENKGKYNGELNHGWDVDHIIPLATAKTERELIKLNHYTNLQPLCSKINRDIKKDKINFFIQKK